ncbi:MAG: tetratricopeptide repeat protein [Candidatus Nitrospinota bacterium M3_3B_026]
MTKRKRDRRALALGLSLAGVLALGTAIHFAPDIDFLAYLSLADEEAEKEKKLKEHVDSAVAAEVDKRFRQAVAMLHAKKYEYAASALHRVLELRPRMPEAHVNMGFAMLGMDDYKAARDFFEGAIDIHPSQENAYYGLSLALRELGDLEGAVGAMRTYVHLVKPDSPYLEKARASLEEMENELTEKRGERSVTIE